MTAAEGTESRPGHPEGLRLRRLPTTALTSLEARAIRAMLDAAFGFEPDDRFTEEDWQHALGGIHVVLDLAGEILAHGSIVTRELHIAGRPLRTGYVEAVATAPFHQGLGYGSHVMREVGDHIRTQFELGALGTSSQRFYEKLGWRTWRGPSSVRTPTGELPTPDEDGYIMVLLTPSSPDLDFTDPISCDWRPGDVW